MSYLGYVFLDVDKHCSNVLNWIVNDMLHALLPYILTGYAHLPKILGMEIGGFVSTMFRLTWFGKTEELILEFPFLLFRSCCDFREIWQFSSCEFLQSSNYMCCIICCNLPINALMSSLCFHWESIGTLYPFKSYEAYSCLIE